MPISSIARPSKNYPNLDFWFENIPSGNPGLESTTHDCVTVKQCDQTLVEINYQIHSQTREKGSD
jgi:hypothetical protein